MRYYCPNCKTEERITKEMYHQIQLAGKLSDDDDGDDLICCVCDGDHVMELIPDYETPEQYEKRTGKAYSDEGAVWVSFLGHWLIREWGTAREWGTKANYNPIVIADPPVPPPDDWRPQ